MLTIGVDAHKHVHVAVALDPTGREVGRWRGANRPDDWQGLLAWAVGLGERRQWGVEGAGNYGHGLAQHLVAAGEAVREVNPRLTAEGRRRARRRDKTDRLDAHAVGRAVQREERLPAVAAEGEAEAIDLLVAEREAAVAEATRLRNRAHQLLGRLDPAYQARLPRLTTAAGVAALAAYAAEGDDLRQQRAAAVRRLARRLQLVLEQVAELDGQIEPRARARWSPLLEICGVGPLTAAALAGILGSGPRFASEAQVAAYAGVAPLEASSAGRVRHRLNRGGHRQLNAIIYRIAVTQARHSPAARAYLARRVAEGKTKREALRALKRYIVRAVWKRWQECHGQVGPAAGRAA